MKTILYGLLLVAGLKLSAPRGAQAQCLAPRTTDRSSCGPGSIELAAYSLGAGPNVSHLWYTSPTGGNFVSGVVERDAKGMGVVTTYTADFSQTTTYYVSSYDIYTRCESDRTPVTATVLPGAPFSVPDVSICGGSGRAALTTYEIPPGSTVVWYDAAGTQAGTGSSFITPMLYNSTYYTAEVSAPGYCSYRKQVSITLHPGYSTPWVSASPVCPGQRATLTAGGAPEGSYYLWFNETGEMRQSPSTSGTYTTDVLNTATTFYVAYRLPTEPFCMSSSVPVQVQMGETAPPTAGGGGSSCGPGRITLSAVTPGSPTHLTHRWYTTPTGGNPISGPVVQPNGSQSLVTTYAADFSQTTPYYVSTYNSSTNCESVRTPLVATVNTPSPFAVSHVALCSSGAASLEVTGAPAGSTIIWKDAAGTQVARGTGPASSFTTPVLASSTYYTVEVSAAGYCNARKQAVVTVSAAPTVHVDPVCSGQPAILTASGAPEGSHYIWYDAAGQVLQTPAASNVYTTAVLSTATTFYVAYQLQTASFCTSSRVPVSVVVHPSPAVPTSAFPSYSLQDEAAIPEMVTPGAGGTVCRWYTTPSGGSYAHQGNIYVPVIDCNSTQTFYASSYNATTGCESSQRLAVNVTVGTLFCRTYVRTNVIHQAGITQDAQIRPLLIGARQESIVYLDELGRPIQ
jgi:hypothetical protein